jgi:hypothetical protein
MTTNASHVDDKAFPPLGESVWRRFTQVRALPFVPGTASICRALSALIPAASEELSRLGGFVVAIELPLVQLFVPAQVMGRTLMGTRGSLGQVNPIGIHRTACCRMLSDQKGALWLVLKCALRSAVS